MGDVETEGGCISLCTVMRTWKLSHPLHTVAVQQRDDAVVLETVSLTLLTNNDLQYMKTVNTMTRQRLVSPVSHRNSVLGNTTMAICVFKTILI